MKVVLVACVKSKLSHAAPVAELYTSPLFKGSLRFARLLNADRIFVLSAKHGLLSLDDVIEPYEDTLKGKSRSQQREWAKRVRLQLSQTTNLEVTILYSWPEQTTGEICRDSYVQLRSRLLACVLDRSGSSTLP